MTTVPGIRGADRGARPTASCARAAPDDRVPCSGNRATGPGGCSRRRAARPAKPGSRTTGAWRCGGFTLIELLTALLILSLLALMSYRGLAAVLEAREHVTAETDKWRHVAAFFARFESDINLAAPRPVRAGPATAPAWLGRAEAAPGRRLEISRFASAEGIDTPRRMAYALNAQQQIELWLWPGLDVAPDVLPARYPVLDGVATFEVRYLNADRAWVGAWPTSPRDADLPRAVRLRLVLVSGEQIVRVFGLKS